MNLEKLLPSLTEIARNAGHAIMQIYSRADFGVVSKQDNSPLTAADMAAHHLINTALQKLTPELPILSEEAAVVPWEIRRHWPRYWLVDPLDGTREFIKRNGEFTVNIALIDAGVPVLGIVYVPVQELLYAGVQSDGAWKEQNGHRISINTAKTHKGQKHIRIVASRNHPGEQLNAWLANAASIFPALKLVSIGSSLKLCLVAEGSADIYPRLSPTSEWDTAAAHAVLLAAGGKFVDTNFAEYRYNRKESLLNPFFYAAGDRDFDLSVFSPAQGHSGSA